MVYHHSQAHLPPGDPSGSQPYRTPGNYCSANLQTLTQPIVDSCVSDQLMLLLALFVKPLFARGSDGLIFIRFRHRRTVVRNTACTVGVVLLQLAETVVVYTVVYHKGSVEQVRTHA